MLQTLENFCWINSKRCNKIFVHIIWPSVAMLFPPQWCHDDISKGSMNLHFHGLFLFHTRLILGWRSGAWSPPLKFSWQNPVLLHAYETENHRSITFTICYQNYLKCSPSAIQATCSLLWSLRSLATEVCLMKSYIYRWLPQRRLCQRSWFI